MDYKNFNISVIRLTANDYTKTIKDSMVQHTNNSKRSIIHTDDRNYYISVYNGSYDVFLFDCVDRLKKMGSSEIKSIGKDIYDECFKDSGCCNKDNDELTDFSKYFEEYILTDNGRNTDECVTIEEKEPEIVIDLNILDRKLKLVFVDRLENISYVRRNFGVDFTDGLLGEFLPSKDIEKPSYIFVNRLKTNPKNETHKTFTLMFSRFVDFVIESDDFNGFSYNGGELSTIRSFMIAYLVNSVCNTSSDGFTIPMTRGFDNCDHKIDIFDMMSLNIIVSDRKGLVFEEVMGKSFIPVHSSFRINIDNLKGNENKIISVLFSYLENCCYRLGFAEIDKDNNERFMFEQNRFMNVIAKYIAKELDKIVDGKVYNKIYDLMVERLNLSSNIISLIHK